MAESPNLLNVVKTNKSAAGLKQKANKGVANLTAHFDESINFVRLQSFCRLMQSETGKVPKKFEGKEAPHLFKVFFSKASLVPATN